MQLAEIFHAHSHTVQASAVAGGCGATRRLGTVRRRPMGYGAMRPAIEYSSEVGLGSK
jgi:hypothetical protein